MIDNTKISFFKTVIPIYLERMGKLPDLKLLLTLKAKDIDVQHKLVRIAENQYVYVKDEDIWLLLHSRLMSVRDPNEELF